MEFDTLSSGCHAILRGSSFVQHQFKEPCQGLPYLGVPACNLLRRSTFHHSLPGRRSTFQHSLPGMRHRTLIFTNNGRLYIKGFMMPSPPLARGCVNQHHNTLAATVGLFLPDHINHLMVALIAYRPTRFMIQHETECHMVARITWVATRTMPSNDSFDLL